VISSPSLINIDVRSEKPFFLSTKAQEIQELAHRLHWAEMRNHPETRNLLLPVTNPTEWHNIKEDLEDLYYFLTDKKISLKFEQSNQPNYLGTKLPFGGEAPLEVCLFSGGVDSGAYASMMARKHEHAVLSHTATSRTIYGKARRFFTKYLSKSGTSMVASWIRNGEQVSGLSQTRGLVFLANAISIAEHLECKTVVIPENGPLMINPPVSRRAQATKTSNPEMIANLVRIVNTVLGSEIVAKTPFVDRTRGEITLLLPESMIADTYSCFSSQGQDRMCGICFACFTRILACAAIGVNERIEETYLRNPFEVNVSTLSETNLRKARILIDALAFWRSTINPETLNSLERKRIDRMNKSFPVMKRQALEMLVGVEHYSARSPAGGAVGKFAKSVVSSLPKDILDAREEELLKLAASLKVGVLYE
jgi:7-cyano-7-deazaguanine synthase in queuosine biosynthesis